MYARAAITVIMSGSAEPMGWAYPTAVLVRALTAQGNLEEADQALDAVPEPWPRHVNSFWLYAARAGLRCEQQRDEEALSDLTSALSTVTLPRSIAPISVGAASRDIVLVLDRMGRPDDARALAKAELERGRAFRSPRTLGLALRGMAMLERGQDGIALAREAVDVLSVSRARLEHAHALVTLGMLQRRDGQRSEAQASLREGLDLARRCGTASLADRARDELVAAGAKPRRDMITGRDALTAAELRVARLAAEGSTNREIAQTLYLSQKTVEMHLGRVYRKLSISSREHLPDTLTA
jgi:DNA-binding CsgD family transcriptional regulator